MRDYIEPANNSTEVERKTAELLLKYPSLEEVFDENQLRNLPETKRKIEETINELERTVRVGSKEEAEKASRVIEACTTTLDFLAELEERRKN